MRVLVLGSGVVGTASAYYLARAGFEVVVVDRQPAVAMEANHSGSMGALARTSTEKVWLGVLDHK